MSIVLQNNYIFEIIACVRDTINRNNKIVFSMNHQALSYYGFTEALILLMLMSELARQNRTSA